MLHRVKYPACLDDMKVILKYQRRFLRFCLFQIPPIDENKCKAWFGNDIGIWTWKRIKKGNGFSKFGSGVNDLITYAQANPADRAEIYKKICHDHQFPIKRSNTTFAFQYPSISTKWKDALKPFLESFYTHLLSSVAGFPKAIFNLKKTLSRKSFMDDQYEANKPVCPYCDDRLGDRIVVKDANDAEHWLPKSKYPHLSIHWANLFRACRDCNSTFKKANNPIQYAGNGELERVYHPYDKPACDTASIDVSKVKDSSHYQLQLQDTVNPICVDSMEYCLNISERWTNRVNDRILQADKSALVADAISSLSRRGQVVSPQWLEQEIGILASIRQGEISRKNNAFLEYSILNYQMNTPSEMSEILSAYTSVHS